ncbi:MAG TPA: DUF4139 domain-containing protein, partial [Gemmataceae bacterium]|nr:DUF4139 domain-containing protein [Gemmataceae bacterium]
SAQDSAPAPVNNGNGQARPPAAPLPIRHVVLFSSGVGYFQREGEIDGHARIDLAFPGSDVNDLLKSLVLQDGGGRVSTISYDSPDPIEKTLKSFALDLTTNPSFGQLLNQARGEKVEVTLQTGSTAQPSTLNGIILGMESQRQPHGKDAVIDVEMLNLLCSEGVRGVPMAQVLRVRFLNPALESELRRALDVLASRHDSQKKVVSLTFDGDGKRPVRVGYVVENPIWKTSYRLVLRDGGKAFLQGWAVVENTSDDDWKDVRMALVSGRPISFKMDLYQPLFIPRPTVEPDLFASLRPPVFSGDMGNSPLPATAPAVGGGGGFGPQGGPGNFNPYLNNANPANRYNLMFGQLGGGQLGQQGGQAMLNGQIANGTVNNFDNNNGRLTYEQLQHRQQQLAVAKGKARSVGSALAAVNLKEGVASVASAEEVGDYFQYVLDHKVTLPRQKSALLPIITHDVEAKRVSIFNEGVQPKFPLLGLKFRNTSGQSLMQGPVTVYEGNTYAGDARVLDLQPGEERLVAYALDQGTEVKAEGESAPQRLTAVKIVKGVVHATHRLCETKTYRVKNRTDKDRVLIIEHPVRPDWRLVAPEKPTERSRETYRFEVRVPAGKSLTQQVIEEQSRTDVVALSSADDKLVRVFLHSRVVGPKVKEAMEKAASLRAAWGDTQRDLAQLQAQLKAITEDQGRLRANFERLPPTSAAYKRYLEKFDTQETEIEKLQAETKKQQETEKAQQKAYEDYLAGLTVE